MKKYNLTAGIIWLLIGIGSLLAAILSDTKLDGMLYAAAGYCTLQGVLTLREYFYWHSPENIERYREYLKNEEINTNDELNEKIRNKSGRYAYLFGVYSVGIGCIVFIALRELEIIESDLVIRVLLIYLILQLTVESIIRKYIMKKY